MGDIVRLRIFGRPFQCSCGCDTFYRFAPHSYTCNACPALYEGDLDLMVQEPIFLVGDLDPETGTLKDKKDKPVTKPYGLSDADYLRARIRGMEEAKASKTVYIVMRHNEKLRISLPMGVTPTFGMVSSRRAPIEEYGRDLRFYKNHGMKGAEVLVGTLTGVQDFYEEDIFTMEKWNDKFRIDESFKEDSHGSDRNRKVKYFGAWEPYLMESKPEEPNF